MSAGEQGNATPPPRSGLSTPPFHHQTHRRVPTSGGVSNGSFEGGTAPPSNATGTTATPMYATPPWGTSPPPENFDIHSVHDLVGHLTHNQVAELNEAYRMLSADSTGKSGITPKHLSDVMTTLGYHPHEDELLELIRHVDQQKTNNITFPEFLLLMTARVQEHHIQEIKAAFRHYDKNNTGFVSATEFCEMFATMGEKSSPEEVDELLVAADPDGTGKVAYGKFIEDIVARMSDDYNQ